MHWLPHRPRRDPRDQAQDEQAEGWEVCTDETNTKPGWYYYDTDYTDEGSCGPYPTRIAAIRAARHDAEIDAQNVGVFYMDRPPGEAPWPPVKP